MADVILPRLLQARACLCDALADAGLSVDLCLCSVVHGDPPLEMVANGKGIAWVRLIRTFPSSTLPVQDTALSNCGAPLAARIELGVARCAVTPGRNGMTQVEYETMAAMAMADHAAMQAAACCLEGDVITGEYLPQREGGIFGGVLVLDIGE